MSKRLVLSVVSDQRDSLGANYSHSFAEGIGNIGRDDTCEWSLPDSAVSRRHAAVRLLNGTFFIEDYSTNGTFVGGLDEEHRLTRDQPRPLATGDRIQIGDYEIVAAIEAGAPDEESTAVPPQTPSTSAAPSPGPSPPASVPPASPPPAAPGGSATGESDPLKLLGAGSPPPPSAPAGPRDELPGGHGVDAAMPPLASVPAEPRGGGGQIPSDWWKQPDSEPPSVGPPPPEAPPPAPPPATNAPAAGPAYDEQLVRQVVAGLMDVLGGRAEIKRRFRVSMTVMQARENNPLKFAADAGEAMAKLFGESGGGYLPAPEAFDETFRDLKAHQLAMLAGMREAFEKMLKQFDPYRLEVRFEKTLGKGKLPFIRDRHWELYKELYDELTVDAEDSFHRLFGNAFAAAYEKEMQKLMRRPKRGE